MKIAISNDSVTSHGYRLVHNKQAIDLSRAGKGLPLLISHDQTQLPIGRVNNLKLERKVLTGEITFGTRGADVEADMRAGVLTDVSVGAEFSPDDSSDDDGVIVVNKWRPIEVSAVSIGAIEGASVMHSRKSEVIDMSDAERREGIKAAFAPFSGAEFDKLHIKALQEDWSVEQVQNKLLNHFASRARKDDADELQGTSRVQMGASDREKYLQGAELAVRYMSNAYAETEQGRAERKADQQAMQGNEFAGLSLIELARVSLERQGVRCQGLTRDRIADLALRGTPQTHTVTMAGGHTSSDFTSLIGTTAYKMLAAGYEDAPETWRQWVSIKSMSNFQQHTFPNLSAFSDLSQRVEGGVYTHGTFSDKHEVMTLKEYGKLFRIDRQTLINDDLNAFTAIPRRMGLAASRNVGDLVYAILTTGTTATMTEDGVALFNAATHNNYITSGAAPSVTTLNTGLTQMATQTDPSTNATLGVRPRYLLVPIALEATSRVLLASTNDPAITPEVRNPFQNAFQLVADHRLDTFNSSGWFLAAAPGQLVETVAVGFLNGQDNPSLTEVDDDIAAPGITYRVMHDAVAGALDWRGLFYNDGVT